MSLRLFLSLSFLGLSSCGLYPLGDDGHAPSASKEQIEEFLADCEVEGAEIQKGSDQETEWTVALGEQPKAKWDCYEEKKHQAGVIATSWGVVTEYK